MSRKRADVSAPPPAAASQPELGLQMPEICSKSEFAQLAGFGKSYVSALAKAGRLVLTDDGQVRVQESFARIKATTGAPERAAPAVQGSEYSASQERDRFYAAELKRLEYEAAVKATMRADDVQAVVADAAARIRVTVESWRTRLPSRIAALGGAEHRIAALLGDETEQLLRKLATQFAELAKAKP